MIDDLNNTKVDDMEIKDDLHIPNLPKRTEPMEPVKETFEKPELSSSIFEKANFYLDKTAKIANTATEFVKAFNNASNMVYGIVILLVILCLIFIGTKIF
jgi:hypothetical protein